jgi:hypothetical protein
VILTGAGDGTDTKFRTELAEMGMPYVAGSMSSVSVWKPQQMPQPAKKWEGKGRPAKFLWRGPANWRYPLQLSHRASSHAGIPTASGRHNPHSIASLRRTTAGFLLRRLARCLLCGPLRF